jgi:hypothetical protein
MPAFIRGSSMLLGAGEEADDRLSHRWRSRPVFVRIDVGRHNLGQQVWREV